MESNKQLRYRRKHLPYGLWTCADGREVLFNREYQPIYQRKNGVLSPADPNEWVDYTSQRFFYSDRKARFSKTREKIENLLEDFRQGLEISHEMDVD